MSIYDKATLVQIPSGYKASGAKLYSVLPANGDGDFTVSADADATRVNSDGLIESTAANQARLNYDFTNPQDPHLLLEPSRTNQITKSRDFEGWQDLSGSETVTNNDATAPNGANTAATIEKTGSDNTTLRFYTTYTNFSTVRSASIYIKKLSGSPTVSFGITDTQDSITPTDEWVRYTKNNVTPSDFGVNIFVDIEVSGVSGDKIAVWGAQLEEGTYSTSLIPTSGSLVTRTADSCEIASGLENLIGQTEGTLFIDFEYLYETTTDSSTDALRDIFVMGTTSDISEGITFDNYRSQFRIFVQGSGMTTQSIGSGSTGTAQPNTRYKLAVKYKTGDCKAYLNGSLLGSGTGTVSFAADLDGIFFSYNDSSRLFKNQKKVYQLMVFNEALSDSELQTLTS